MQIFLLLLFRQDEQAECDKGLPTGADDGRLHRGGANTLPRQHHQQVPGDTESTRF